jgi:iron(III) transport system permease protein
MNSGNRMLGGSSCVLAALALLPVAAVVTTGVATAPFPTWSHLAATVLPGFVTNTLWLVLLVGCGVAFGGTLCAWLVTNRRFPGARWFEWALLLPLAMPAYVMAYAYTDLLEYAGPVQSALRSAFGWTRRDTWFPDVRSIGGAAAMFVAVLYPYVYLFARTAFIERPMSLVDAARTMGVNARGVFWRVDLPLARPAIAGGIALALMETLADYGTVAYFSVDTFTTGIYRAWFVLGDRVAAAQLAMLLLGCVVTALVVERASRGAATVAGSARCCARPRSSSGSCCRCCCWRALPPANGTCSRSRAMSTSAGTAFASPPSPRCWPLPSRCWSPTRCGSPPGH